MLWTAPSPANNYQKFKKINELRTHALRLGIFQRENRELRQANEILRKASAYFATAELDRRYKP
jgi:transposase-like protein